jgi:hypothetical protein
VKIASNEILLKLTKSADEYRRQLAEATDERVRRDIGNRLAVAEAIEAGGVPQRFYKRCTVQYSYEGLDGLYRTPWAAARAFLDQLGETD